MKKFLTLIFVGLYVCLVSGCCCCSSNPNNPTTTTTQNGPYLTVTMLSTLGNRYLYVTTRPIEPIEYVWVESDEYSDSGHYFGEYNTSNQTVPHVTEWSDGSKTLTVGAFENATYTHTETGEFNDDQFVIKTNAPIQPSNTRWVGTAPNNLTIADYNDYAPEILIMTWIINFADNTDTDYVPTRGGYSLKNRPNNETNNDDDNDTEDENNNITTNDGVPAF
ncbi:MAG: hypothetical protein LBE18_03930 [Planctomycetaceae bacterium]|jgi:hypothetical protein|nr:hypothetical protein [Planctomycetaceae bacterium]